MIMQKLLSPTDYSMLLFRYVPRQTPVLVGAVGSGRRVRHPHKVKALNGLHPKIEASFMRVIRFAGSEISMAMQTKSLLNASTSHAQVSESEERIVYVACA